MFDYTSDEDMLPDGHLDDPRINDIKQPFIWYWRNFIYDLTKKLGILWVIDKVPFLEKKQWVKDRERPF